MRGGGRGLIIYYVFISKCPSEDFLKVVQDVLLPVCHAVECSFLATAQYMSAEGHGQMPIHHNIYDSIFLFLPTPSRQWLPPDKIEPLGMSAEYDSAKVAASGPSKRSVQQAFQRAKQYQRKVAQSVAKESTSSSDTEDDDGVDS